MENINELSAEEFDSKIHALMDNLEIGIVIFHGKSIRELVPVFCNEGYLKLSGLTYDQFKTLLVHKHHYGVHPDDIEGARAVFADAYYKNEIVHHTMRVHSEGEDYRWVTMTGKIHFLKDDSFDVYMIFENAEEYVHEQQILRERYSNLIEKNSQSASQTIAAFHLNLTTDESRSLNCAICLNFHAVTEIKVNSCIDTLSRNIADDETRKRYTHKFSREALISSFEKGSLSLEMKLPIRLNDDRTLWCHQFACLSRNPDNGQVECVISLVEDDKELRLRESFRRMMRTDYEFIGNMNVHTGMVNIIYEKRNASLPPLPKNMFAHDEAVALRMPSLVEEEFVEQSIYAMSLQTIISELEKNETYMFSFPAKKEVIGHNGVFQWRFGYIGDTKEEVVFSRTEMIGFLDSRHQLQIEQSEAQKKSIAIGEAAKSGAGYRNKILIAEDADIDREILRHIFYKDFSIIEATDGEEAMQLIDDNHTRLALILLDMQMPKKTGLDVLIHMQMRNLNAQIPVMMVTGATSRELNLRSWEYGISDIVNKPLDSKIIKRRALNLIELYAHKEEIERQLDEWKKDAINMHVQEEKNDEILINTLSSVVEIRSMESGLHVRRVRALTEIMLRTWPIVDPDVRLSDIDISIISRASMLHDIGKVAIPDSILLKPGKLTSEEFDIMKTHSILGCEMLENIEQKDDEFYRYCYDICRYHHERCDGRGYPDGLKGDEIPFWAQIVSIVDVFDALISPRVYKAAYSVEQAVEMIRNGECGVFSKKLLECFDKAKALIIEKSIEMSQEIQKGIS